ncbi:glutathione transferase GstA [Verticiella sediminum]|uniref:Glutathione transferase GstA n=1 Tax=Verticiella sediminum TaxID=1247510 RepID=A0A556A6K3_9BURK|nr:glutathione transferase GstA [Verticiella sediminum]TSH88509.1 glutathione transferase GstA [Verticiella sediminum]
MKLYFAPGTCALSPHIVLAELGLPYETARVDLKTHQTADGQDYYTINPKGYVPALEVDGEILTEGPAIVQYLADQKPEAGLVPPVGTLGRARVHEWLTYIGTEIHKNFKPFFANGSDEAKAAAKEVLTKRFAYADERLKGRDFLTGDKLSAADPYLFVVGTWAEKVGLPLGDDLKSFIERMKARAGVQKAMKEQGLLG